MKKLVVLGAALMLATTLQAQTPKVAERNMGRGIAGWVWITVYSTSTLEAEHLQGFPATHFGAFMTVNGIWAHVLGKKTNSSVPNGGAPLKVFIRKDDGTGKPDVTAAGIIAQASGTTATITSTSLAWKSNKIYFKKPVVLPTTKPFWASVRLPVTKQYTVYCAGQNHFDPKNNTLCGVSPRPDIGKTSNLTVKLAYTQRFDPATGKPAGGLMTSTYFYAWYCVGLLTSRPLLSQYSMCPVQRKTKSTNNSQWCPANKADYTYAGMWPDLVNKEADGRYDKFGWKIEEYNYKSGNTQWGFIILSNAVLPAPIPTPYGDWLPVLAGPWYNFSTGGVIPDIYPAILKNGAYETKPVDPPKTPAFIRQALLGTWCYGQCIYTEFDSAMNLVNLQLSNMAGISF